MCGTNSARNKFPNSEDRRCCAAVAGAMADVSPRLRGLWLLGVAGAFVDPTGRVCDPSARCAAEGGLWPKCSWGSPPAAPFSATVLCVSPRNEAQSENSTSSVSSRALYWLKVVTAGVGAVTLAAGVVLVVRKLRDKRLEYLEHARNNEFLQAACDGNLDKMVQFILDWQDLSCADKNGSNALMLAAWAGRREAVLMLLHNGVDVHKVSHHGWTALTYAARAGEASTVETLLDWGADPNVVEKTTGATPLMFAAYVGSLECVELLLDEGADPLIATRQGALAFAFAEENGHEGIAGMLRHRAADAQAEVQAMKEKEEALAARQKARQAIILRQKQEQAFSKRLQEQRERAAIERSNYMASFKGQLEMLSVGCYVPLDRATIKELVTILMERPWGSTNRPGEECRRSVTKHGNVVLEKFQLVHRDLTQRRALNALSRPLQRALPSTESDSESSGDENENSSESGSAEERDAPPPVRLGEILRVSLQAFSLGPGNEMPDGLRAKLALAAKAVSFGDENPFGSTDFFEHDVDRLHTLRILHGIGQMAAAYLDGLGNTDGALRASRIYLPYFLQVDPNIFALIAETLGVLGKRYFSNTSDFPRDVYAAVLLSFLNVVKAHLATVAWLRFETTRIRDDLAILADALLFISLSKFEEDRSLDDGEESGEFSEENDPQRFAGEILVQYLRLISRSAASQTRFFAQLWIRSKAKAWRTLRDLAANAIEQERAISYLVCAAADSPRPNGDVPSSKRRLANVLGLTEFTCAHGTGTQQNGRKAISSSDFANERSKGFSQRRESSSMASRVRVRSVLGESSTTISSGILKRGSQALLSIQRAAKSFISSGKDHADRRRKSAQEERSDSMEDESPLLLGDSGSKSAFSKRIIPLEEIEGAVCADNSNLVQGKVPARVLEWIEDTRPVQLRGDYRGWQHSSSSENCSDPTSHQVDPELLSDFSSLVGGPELSFAEDDSSKKYDTPDLIDVLLHSVVEEKDVASAVVLRCVQDDLVSRLLIIFQSRKRARLQSSVSSTPTSPDKVEKVLLRHTESLFELCSKRWDQFGEDSGAPAVIAGTDEEVWLLEDVACELMERMMLLSEWAEGCDNLSPILLKLLRNRRLPDYLKSASVKLLCAFATGKMKHIEFLTQTNESIEALLSGPLFSQPAAPSSEELEEAEVFLQELARSPAPPTHQSDAQGLHAMISSRPELRIARMQAKNKPVVLEDMVRISAAAYLKHTGLASTAYSEASGISEIVDPSQRTAKSNLLNFNLVEIWKAAWATVPGVVSAHRASQVEVCAIEGCQRLVVQDQDGENWRCEAGHISENFSVLEKRTYQEICADVAARARILLNLNPGEFLDGGVNTARLGHAKHFVQAAVQDALKSDKIELYLKAKARYCMHREQALRLVRDVLNISHRICAGSTEIDENRSFTAIKDTAKIGRNMSECPLLEGNETIGGISMNVVLDAVREVYESMPRPKDSPGRHVLDFQLPSPNAHAVRDLSLDILDSLLKVAEHSVHRCDLTGVLSVIQIISVRQSEHQELRRYKVLPRLIELAEKSNRSNDGFLQGCVWSVLVRVMLQSMSSRQGEDFTELQTDVLETVCARISKYVEALATEDDDYAMIELLCHRWLCLMGALCWNSEITAEFASTLTARNSQGTSFQDESGTQNLIIALITSRSPRIQQLAIRLGRRVLDFCEPEFLVEVLFDSAGAWALSLRGFQNGSRAVELGMECAHMVRHLVAKSRDRWRPAVMALAAASALEYMTSAPDCSEEVLFRLWTSLAVLDVSSPSVLRAGCRVKILGGPSAGGMPSAEEYGIVISTSKKSDRVDSNVLRYASEFVTCMVVQDSDSAQIPVKCDAEKLVPVTILLEEYRDFYAGIRGFDWLLDVIEFFGAKFWSHSLRDDLVWYELKTLAMSVLHAWLSTDAHHAIQQITGSRPRMWRHVVTICASPAPRSSLENVDDLTSTAQALSDIKGMLCELGFSPLDSMKERISRKQDGASDEILDRDDGGMASMSESLLVAPALDPRHRANLARQASVQIVQDSSSEFFVDEEEESEEAIESPELAPVANTKDNGGGALFSVRSQMEKSPRTLRRSSSSSNGAPSPRSHHLSTGSVVSAGHRDEANAKKAVRFDTPLIARDTLKTPFQERDRENEASFATQLLVERNRRRARMERKNRAKRRMRTLSSSSACRQSRNEAPSLEHLQIESETANSISVLHPDTPRGRDAANLPLPVALPTVDTMLPVPVSSGSSSLFSEKGSRATQRTSRVKEGSLLRLSEEEVGVVMSISCAIDGTETVSVDSYNTSTGMHSTSLHNLADVELCQDIISDRYSNIADLQEEDSSSSSGRVRLFEELKQLYVRSAIMNARRGAVAAISGAVGSLETDRVELLVGEAGGASQVLGMFKLCESSAFSDLPNQRQASRMQDALESGHIAGLWRAMGFLFSANDDFADLLLDEAILYLSVTAKETIFFETPHPLCPSDVAAIAEQQPMTDSEEHEEDSEDALSRGSSSGALLSPNRFFDRGGARGSGMNQSLSSFASSPSRATSPGSDLSEVSAHDSQTMQFSSRRLTGKQRFHIPGASGMLIEFDKRSSIIAGGTQVTISYDMQDRDVIKVLGEEGTDSWHPVVVSGDTCYLHWNVNQSDIIASMQRLLEFEVDVNEVAWGVAVRVCGLEDVTNADETQLLERPFGSRLMKIIAENPRRVLERKERGITLFETLVGYLRTSHLSSKPDLCEVLTLLASARMEELKEDFSPKWDAVMQQGLYKLHHDLLILFDEVAEDGFSSVSPYFVCLLELLVRCRRLWGLHPNIDSESENGKAPLCSLVIFGRRENSKVVIDCKTCKLTGENAICLACAATCHAGHKLRHERTMVTPCGCSLRGPDSCKALRPTVDIWSIAPTDRTWFDVVCQTSDVVKCIASSRESQRPLPSPFVRESFRTCEDGKLLRLCLRSFEECLRSEVQDVWWDREARHMWANMLDQGMDSVVEVSFGLQVLTSSLLSVAFVFWWQERKDEWMRRIHTNQAWELAQAMLQLSYSLAPSAYYSEWDGRLHNWSATLKGIAALGTGEGECTFLLTGEFPSPQLYVHCMTCSKEVCETCAARHANDGHELSEETFGSGFCDERTPVPPEKAQPRSELFSIVSQKNFLELHDLYWTNHDNDDDSMDAQVPTEPRTLGALLNVPHVLFSELNDPEKESGLVPCVSKPGDSSLLSPSLQGILIELLGVKEDTSFLCVSCELDHGHSLALGAMLSSGGSLLGNGVIHGYTMASASAQAVQRNMHLLRTEFLVPIGPIEVFCGDFEKEFLAHTRAVSEFWKKGGKKRNNADDGPAKAIPGMLSQYDRIFCTGVCSLMQLDALSAMLPRDGALLCPMVESLGYGIYVQRNQFTGECENRTLAPLYDDSKAFLEEIARLKKILASGKSDNGHPQIDEVQMRTQKEEEQKLEEDRKAARELVDRMAEPWDMQSWIALANFANKATGRETSFLGFRDLTHTSLSNIPQLEGITDLKATRGRFAVLKRVNDSLSEVLPLINLTPKYDTRGFGHCLARTEAKKLMFLATKIEAWSKVMEPGWSESSFGNMPSITVSRNLADLGMVEDSLFMQTFNQIQNIPHCALRRRDQSFRVRFAGEGGHDAGGLYRDLISNICAEIRSGRPPIMFQSPLMSKAVSETLLPRPSLLSSFDLQLFEFVGNLLGIACMRHGITLSMDFSPLIWKILVGETLLEQDLRYIDEVAHQMISFIRRSTPEEIESVLQDHVFAVAPSDAFLANVKHKSRLDGIDTEIMNVTGQHHSKPSNKTNTLTGEPALLNGTDPGESASVNVVELCPLGKQRKVTAENCQEYADLLERFRLSEIGVQIDAMKRGIAPLVPARLMPVFNWQELQGLCCGVADIDVETLHSRTKYIGGMSVTDKSIKYFWDVLSNDFSPEDRTQFLRFVWGRERMSEVDDITFTIGPHLQARDSGNPDAFLPQAHTCFMSLSLPEYTSHEIMKNRLLFAINNCNAIDADDTGEGVANRALSF